MLIDKMQSAQIIEDIFSAPQGEVQPQQNHQHVNANPSNPAYGMQLPQPLKQTQALNASYQASSNTLNSFNYYGNINESMMGATQSGAIRGRVTSPHVYQWDAKPIEQQQKDFKVQSGMTMKQNAWQGSITLDPKQSLREAIAGVYGAANMLKTHQMGNFSVYKCPVENLTTGNYKYIVAIVPNHEFVPLGSYYSLQSLPWISFQTRATDNPASEFGNIRPQSISYAIPNETKHPLFDKINMVLDDAGKFVYLSESMPCKVELLKLGKGDVAAPKSTIMSALEAFKTVITLTD